MRKIRSVCIVEDDPIQAFITQKYLEQTGMVDKISVYRNGKDAFDNLNCLHQKKASLPELILLDLNMPVWDGWIFLDEIYKTDQLKNITIYILTSSNSVADLQKAATYNLADRYLVKPICVQNLTRILESISITNAAEI